MKTHFEAAQEQIDELLALGQREEAGEVRTDCIETETRALAGLKALLERQTSDEAKVEAELAKFRDGIRVDFGGNPEDLVVGEP